MTASVFKRPSAWLPLVMSLAAIGLIVLHVARFGITHDTDEGTSAHLFQLLMGLQPFVIGYFAFRCLPENPRQATGVLAMQLCVAALPFIALYWMEHAAH